MRLAQTQKKKIKEDEQAFSHLIIIREVDDLEADTGPTEAQKTLENEEGFQHGQGMASP